MFTRNITLVILTLSIVACQNDRPEISFEQWLPVAVEFTKVDLEQGVAENAGNPVIILKTDGALHFVEAVSVGHIVTTSLIKRDAPLFVTDGVPTRTFFALRSLHQVSTENTPAGGMQMCGVAIIKGLYTRLHLPYSYNSTITFIFDRGAGTYDGDKRIKIIGRKK